MKQFDINRETGECIIIARNPLDNDSECLQFPGVDSEKPPVHLEDTTPTLYRPHRYAELTLEEIQAIQNK